MPYFRDNTWDINIWNDIVVNNEYEALSSCKQLDKINCIVGEFHNTAKFSINHIEEYLIKNYNFSYHYRSNHLGLFGAHKK